MTHPNIFEIRNLRCSYDGQKDVLEIKTLDIPRGKFVALLSVSGGGKSTALESLGLMNRTFRKDSEIILYPHAEEDGYDYRELWLNRNESLAASIRSKHFSFIFQQTNLMPNFTAYENICISQMIQGKSQAEALAHVREVMALIGLDEVEETKKSWELSGGQQQRVAFARAITPDFSVIFGDEPTGNLDPQNAHALMQKLYEAVKEKKRTAIVVSHDLDLVQEYADMMLVITKPDQVGMLELENIFQCEVDASGRRQWSNSTGEQIEDIVPRIRKTMKNQAS